MKLLLTLLLALFAAGVSAEEVGYRFPSDGKFSNESSGWYQTWTSNDGVLKIEGDSEYSFYAANSYVAFYEATFTMSVTTGNTILSYAINMPRGGKKDDQSSVVVFWDANDIPTTLTTGAWSNFNLEYTINAAETTFDIGAEGDSPYMAVYNDYFVITVNKGAAPDQPTEETKQYTFATGGTFTNQTDYEGYTYYKTWTSNDGNVTIEGSDDYTFSPSGSWYFLAEGTLKISAKGQLKSLTISYPSGSSFDGGTITDEDGNTYTIPANADQSTYGPTITLSDINATSVTLTITGTVAIADGYLTIKATADEGGSSDEKVSKELTFTADGQFTDETSMPDGSKYYKTWTSNDGALTITGPNDLSFYGPDADNLVTLEPGEYTVTVTGKDVQIKSFEIQYPSAETATTFTDHNGNVSNVPANPDRKTFGETPISVQNINAAETTFTVGGIGMFIRDGYAKFVIETAGGDNPGDDPSDDPGDDSNYITYTLDDGSYDNPYVDGNGKSWDNYATTWTSNDGMVTLKGDKSWNFFGSGGYWYLCPRTYTASVQEGYTLHYIQISTPYAYYEPATITWGDGNTWELPENEAPTDYYQNIDTNSFTISDAGNTTRVWVSPKYFTFYLTQDDTSGIQALPTGHPDQNAVYDLTGRRVQNPTKGIYIVNGKKILVK